MGRERKIHIAIVVNSLPPYRIHQHLKIAGMRGVKLSTIRLEETTSDRWAPVVPVEINPVDLTHKPVDGVKGIITGLRAVRWMSKNNIDLVIVNGYAKVAYRSLQIACFLIGLPCCLWADNNIHGDVNTGIKSVVKSLTLTCYLKLSRLCLHCGSAGEAYFRKYRVPRHKLQPLPVEPDCESISSLSDREIESTLTRFSMSLNRSRVVFSGRLIALKNPEVVLSSFCEIAPKYPDWDLVFVGDGPLKQSLMQQVPVELRCRVFFTGFLDQQSHVSAIYRASDILLLPSHYEPWALVVHEAVAAGMAVVASDVVGAAIDLVEDDKNGFRCPTGNVLAFAEALEKCISNIKEFKAASLKANEIWMRDNGTVPSLKRLLAKLGFSEYES